MAKDEFDPAAAVERMAVALEGIRLGVRSLVTLTLIIFIVWLFV